MENDQAPVAKNDESNEARCGATFPMTIVGESAEAPLKRPGFYTDDPGSVTDDPNCVLGE